MPAHRIIKTNAYGLLTFQAQTLKSSDLSVQLLEQTQSIESERDDFMLENDPDRDQKVNMFRNISHISRDGTSNAEQTASPVFSRFLKKKVNGFSSLQKIKLSRSTITAQIHSQPQQHLELSDTISSDYNEQDPRLDRSQKSKHSPPKSILSKSNKSSAQKLVSNPQSIAASQLSKKRVQFSLFESPKYYLKESDV